MKQIEVTIMGQSYILGCPDGGETSLLEAVGQVDREMCAIRDAGRVKARERIAVLAALNLAYALAERPAPPLAGHPPDAGDDAHVDALIRRIDQALGADARRLINTDGRQAIQNINKATEEAQAAIASANRSVNSLERPLGEFATTGLPQLTQTIEELNEATGSLQDLIDDVRASPRDFIGRPASKELEVQP